MLWSFVLTASAVVLVGYSAGLPAAIGMLAIMIVLKMGLALQDALGWLVIKVIEGALRLSVFRR